MATDLAQRIKKLEHRVPALPCSNPEHRDLNVFREGVSPEEDRENERRIRSIRACKKCKGKMVVVIEHFDGPVPNSEQAARMKRERVAYDAGTSGRHSREHPLHAAGGFTYEIGDGEPVNASRETPSVSHPDIEVMKWLEELSKECNEDA